MASAEIALVCGLNVWVGCRNWLCVNSSLMRKQICEEVLPQSSEKKFKL